MEMDIDTESDEISEIFLSVFWFSGKLGAAYYNLNSSQVFILSDVAESAPDFWICKQVILQVNPSVIITSAKQDDRLIQTLQNICGIDNLNSSDGIINTNKKFVLLPSFDFGYESSKRRITGISLPNFTKLITDADKAIYLSSIINFHSTAMVRSFGGLLRFLDKNRVGVELEEKQVALSIISINYFNLNNIVFLDENTLSALQIFHKETHPSVYKSTTSAKEGLSLFGVMNRCKSVVGTQKLRSVMLRPSSDVNFIEERQEAVRFFMQIQNGEIVSCIQNSLRHIKNIANILSRMANGQTSMRDWFSLYKTLYNALLIGDIIRIQNKPCGIFKKISETYVQDIISITEVIKKIVNFEESVAKNHFVVNWNVDENLDRKRQNYNALPDLMSKIAREELENLNESVDICTVVYLPQLGYLLEIPITNEMEKSGNFNLPNLEYVFTSNKMVYYRSSRTKGLQCLLGDAQYEITDEETKIMISLQSEILEHASKLIEFIDCIAELDCLISLAIVAKEHNYTQPKLTNENNNILIKGGRHPLQELCVNAFVPNDTRSIVGNKIQLLTGPNASGKSVYLKQVALIVYMAHIGSFVPAERAKICVITKIFTRIHTVESISTGLSKFMIDLNQISLAIKYSDENSLITVDEFGTGTDTVDGVALTASILKHWLEMQEKCPHVFISTNFHSLFSLLPDNQEITYLTMDILQDEHNLVYLYQLTPGKVEHSCALQVAKNAGISENILKRAKQVTEAVSNQQEIQRQENDPEENLKYSAIVSEFLNMDLDIGSVKKFMDKLSKIEL